MSNNKGIPTIGVRGIQFRSRIEAQWAYIFEKLEWNWEYEPIDLEGYIPDFIIKFDEDEILIEIKGDTNSDKCSRRTTSEYPDRASATAV